MIPVWVIIVTAVVGAALFLLAILIVRCVLTRSEPYDRETLTGDGYGDDDQPTRKVVVRRGRIVPAAWNLSLTASTLFGDRFGSHQELDETGGRRSRSPFGMLMRSHDRPGSSHSQMSEVRKKRFTTRQGNMELLNDVDETFLKRTPDSPVNEFVDAKRPRLSTRSISLPSILNGAELADDPSDRRSRPPTSGTLTNMIEEADEPVSPRKNQWTVTTQECAGKRAKNPRPISKIRTSSTASPPPSPTPSQSSSRKSRFNPPTSKFSPTPDSPTARSPRRFPLLRSPLSYSSTTTPSAEEVRKDQSTESHTVRPRTAGSLIPKAPKVVAPPIAPPPRTNSKALRSRPLIPSHSLPDLSDRMHTSQTYSYGSRPHPLPTMLPQPASPSSRHPNSSNAPPPSRPSLSVPATTSEQSLHVALDEGYQPLRPPPIAVTNGPVDSPAATPATLKSLPGLPVDDGDEEGNKRMSVRIRGTKGNVLRKKSLVEKEKKDKGKQRTNGN